MKTHFSWRRMSVMAHKEIVQIRRDPRSLAIVILMPAILVLLFGYGVNLDQKKLPVYVLDQDASQQSQDLLKHFEASEYFHLARVVNNERALKSALDDGRARMGIVISWNFSQRLHKGAPVSVQGLVDATDDNTANVAIGYAQGVIQTYFSQIEIDWLRQRGLTMQSLPLSVETRTWYNEDLESSAFIIPGVLALVMSVIGAFLTSLTIAREWERGTMEQLISTPVSAMEIMLGKLIPYFVLGMLDTLISALIAIDWFRVPFRGSFVTLMMSSALFLVAVLAMGFLISVLARSQFAASQIALLITFLPAFLLSGFLFAIEQMPPVLQWVTRILPARYYVSVLKKIFLKGTPPSMLASDLIPLAVFAIVLTIVATRAFHKKLA
jgi:ABC-2 type transport system permease protein